MSEYTEPVAKIQDVINRTPLRRQVEDAVANLRKAADEIELSHLLNETSGDRQKMIADGRAAIERAKAGGHGYKIFEAIIDDWEHGSPDVRGTDNDNVRQLASMLDSFGPIPKADVDLNVRWHPQSLDETLEIMRAIPTAYWRFERLSDFYMAKTASRIIGLELTVFVKADFAQDVSDYINSLREQPQPESAEVLESVGE